MESVEGVSSLEKIQDGLEELFDVFTTPLSKFGSFISSHTLYNNLTTQKIIFLISSQSIIFFGLTHAYGWYCSPWGFYTGFTVGAAGALISQLGFSTYSYKIIKSKNALNHFPLAMVVLTLFLTTLSRGLLCGFILGSSCIHLGVEYLFDASKKKLSVTIASS